MASPLWPEIHLHTTQGQIDKRQRYEEATAGGRTKTTLRAASKIIPDHRFAVRSKAKPASSELARPRQVPTVEWVGPPLPQSTASIYLSIYLFGLDSTKGQRELGSSLVGELRATTLVGPLRSHLTTSPEAAIRTRCRHR